jgi:hypothetical protein
MELSIIQSEQNHSSFFGEMNFNIFTCKFEYRNQLQFQFKNVIILLESEQYGAIVPSLFIVYS